MLESVHTPVSENEPINCQQTPKEMDADNDIQYLCDNLYKCSLITEIDSVEEDTGI